MLIMEGGKEGCRLWKVGRMFIVEGGRGVYCGRREGC